MQLQGVLACQAPLECLDDSDCDPTQICTVEGLCTTPALGVDGESCNEDSDCESAWCVEVDGQRECRHSCTDATDCADAEVCRVVGEFVAPQLACAPALGEQAGGAPCLDDSDCASALCLRFLCARPCGDCPVGQHCQPQEVERSGALSSLALCVARAAPETIALGPVPTPDGTSMPLSFELPEGVAGFSLVLIDEHGLRVAVAELVAPDGTLLVDADPDTLDLNPAYSYPGAAALLVPASDDPAAAPRAGRYQLRVGTYDPDNWEELVPVPGNIERVDLLIEPADQRGGLIDLQLHFATATGLHLADAADSEFMTGLRGRLGSYLEEQAGLALGDLGYAELPPEHATVEDGDEVRRICRERSRGGAQGLAVNVFLVDTLSFTAGFSGGIPGPVGAMGTPASGIVIEAQSDGPRTGTLLAHELGHFLGLRHTTETTGGRHDPVLDTPECAAGTSATACPDYGNLMFPIFPLNADLELTAGQRQVLAGNPIAYELHQDRACPAVDAVIELGSSGRAAGDTRDLGDALEGSCGGSGAPERVHLLRHQIDGAELRISARLRDAAAVVYVLYERCGEPGVELGCVAGEADARVELSVPAAASGPYFVVVDGQQAEGSGYTLQVETVTP